MRDKTMDELLTANMDMTRRAGRLARKGKRAIEQLEETIEELRQWRRTMAEKLKAMESTAHVDKSKLACAFSRAHDKACRMGD